MRKFAQNRIIVAVAIQNLDVYLLSRSFSTLSAEIGRSSDKTFPTYAAEEVKAGLPCTLRKQEHRHAMKVGKATHFTRRFIGVGGDYSGIGERHRQAHHSWGG